MSDALVIVHAPAETAIARVVEMLLRGGMVLHHRAANSNSFYFGWPGRSGTLRLSDHASRASEKDQECIVARITLHAGSIPRNDDGLTRMAALALGTYLFKAAVKPEKRGS